MQTRRALASHICGSRIRGCRLLRSATSSSGSTTSGSTTSGSTWLSNMVLSYGKVGVATYAGVWLSTISAFFMALQADALSVGDALQATRHVADAVDSDTLRSLAASFDGAVRAVPSGAGNLAVAFVLTKLCKPLRIAATVALTPRLARIARGLNVNPRSGS